MSTKGPVVKELQPPAPPQRNRTPPQQIPLKEQNGTGVPQENISEVKVKTEPPRKTSAEKASTGDSASRKPSNTESKAAKEPVVNFFLFRRGPLYTFINILIY